ncbi:fatty acid CoA ligase FadD22 [Streptomyces sp. 3213]|uniref:class I adenylate-forming enzyme family protein n=1 Tax=Streptomyces sp. 3213.3 TaxID=1855348 RepID=UPI000897D213|nr:AMP-binding protein [Streptomyces sp. 3213.3]SEF00645.1 fatty acid CoA ligase FadD22 [Streptomyces sp. 3213] [Streptomyces sp. 3213.3]
MTDILTDLPAAPAETVPATGNLSVRLEDLARQGGWLGRTAYLQGTHRYSYGEVYEQVRRSAAALRGLGVGRGDRVLLALPDSVAFVVTFLAVLRIGAVAVPVNTFFHADELRSSEEIAEASLVVADASLRAEFRGRGVTPRELTEVYDPAGDDAPEPLASDAPAFAVFTSGTTGAPRLCFHDHGDALHFDRAIGGVLALRQGEVCYSVSRMYFAYGLGNSVLLPLQRGAAVVLSPQRADETNVPQLLERHGVSVFYAQPSFYARLLARPQVTDLLGRLRLALVAGETLPRPLEDRLRRVLGPRLLNICGTSEIGHAVLANGPDEIHPYSLGRILAPYRVRVVDDAGEAVPDGEVGQLQISGPGIGPGVKRGGLPPHRLGPEEWFATGDSARVDAKGLVWLLGRVDDIEIVAGANIHPIEVEDLITGIAGVREAAVCSVRRADGTTSLRAYVVAEPGADRLATLAATIRSTTAAKLTWYKVPEDVEFIDALPRNSTGKILRRVLRGANRELPDGAA